MQWADTGCYSVFNTHWSKFSPAVVSCAYQVRTHYALNITPNNTYEHLYMCWVGSRLCTYSVFLIVLILELGLNFNNFIIVPVTDGDVMRVQ